MTTPTQGEVRSWARARGMTVNDRGSLPTKVVQAYLAANEAPAAPPAPTPAVAAEAAPPAGANDLAGGLRNYLSAIDAEVRAVSVLSEHIDRLVHELNGVRDEQAKRLLQLDELKGAVSDQSLTSFFNKVIRPRQPGVPEILPERLR